MKKYTVIFKVTDKPSYNWESAEVEAGNETDAENIVVDQLGARLKSVVTVFLSDLFRGMSF